MSFSYFDGKVNAEIVVYEGTPPDGLSHTVRKYYGTLLIVHDSNLSLKLPPDISKIPSTPLEFRNEVNKGITKKRSPSFGTPSHSNKNELMDWYHCLYHSSFSRIFTMAKLGHLPERLFDCKKMCLFVLLVDSEQLTASHKGKKS